MLPDLFQPHIGRHHLVLLILETEIFSSEVVTSKYILQPLEVNVKCSVVGFFP